MIATSGCSAKHSERVTAHRASTDFLIYLAVLRKDFRNGHILTKASHKKGHKRHKNAHKAQKKWGSL